MFKDLQQEFATPTIRALIIGKHNQKDKIITEFLEENKIFPNHSKFSNAFCKFFSEVGGKLQVTFPNLTNQFNNYANGREENNTCILLAPEFEILGTIKTLKSKRISDCDGIAVQLLKILSECLANPVTLLIVLSHRTVS